MKHIAALWATLALQPVAWAEVSEADLADIVRNPSIGLYKGYAQFKMARYAEARQIWQALADIDVPDAWFNLGVMSEDGLGEAKDMERALMLYRRGAEAGSFKAQYRLGLIYSEGKLVPPDRAQAERWLSAAAAQGDADAAQRLSLLRQGEAADDPYLHAQNLESAGKGDQAASLYRELSDGGDLRARTRLAWLYESGRGVERNLDKAAALFRSAAEGGEAEAQYALSVMLETGAGQPKDRQQALSWLQKSAAAGYPPAQQALRARQR